MLSFKVLFFLVVLTALEVAQLPTALANCDKYLEPYETDCEIQSEYKRLKSEYLKIGINFEFLAGYRTRRLYSRKALPLSDTEKLTQPWKEFDPSPKTWILWEKANHFRELLSEKLDRQPIWEISVADIPRFHGKAIDPELQFAFFPHLRFFVPGWIRPYPQPGEMQDPNKGHTSTFGGDNRSFTPAEYKLLMNYDLSLSDPETGERIPYVSKLFKSIPFTRNGNNLKGPFTYLPTRYHQMEIDKLVKEINSGMSRYLNGPAPEEAPLKFVARVHRTLIAIHPLEEGNGRNSRIFQDLLLTKLGFPVIPAKSIPETVFLTPEAYSNKTVEAMKESIAVLNGCLAELKSRAPTLKCRLMYGIFSPFISESRLSEVENYYAKEGEKILSQIKNAIDEDQDPLKYEVNASNEMLYAQ